MKTIHGTNVPCSISTALAIEGSFGIHPENKTDVALIEHYDALWINLHTLIRNAYGSVERDDIPNITPEALVDIVNSDITTIKAYIEGHIKGKTDVVVYTNEVDLVSKYPLAKTKRANTDKQIHKEAMFTKAIEKLIAEPIMDIKSFNGRISGTGNVLMLTHKPYDLLSRYEFGTLVLLESHTGKLKMKGEFGTKLKVKDGSLPLHRFTLFVFGDDVDFAPLSTKVTRHVKELAQLDRWTSRTTFDKMRASVDNMRDGDVKDVLVKLMKNT